MGQLTFATVSGDDGWISREAQSNWFPTGPGGPNANSLGGEVLAEKHYDNSTPGLPYFLGVGYMRFDTSSIPDFATITGATLRLYVTTVLDDEGRSMTLEWMNGEAFGTSLYTDVVAQDALAPVTLASIAANLNNYMDFTLLSPSTHINLSGYSSIRMHVTGSTAPASVQPTLNAPVFCSKDGEATYSAIGPRLIVDYTIPMVSVRPDADTTTTGWTTTPLWSKVDEASAGGDVISATAS